jgi:hypothetical protein
MKLKLVRFWLTITIILLGFAPQRVTSAQTVTASKEEYAKVEETLHNYFDTRYKLLSNGSSTEYVHSFEKIESGKSIPEYQKLLIEIEHANLYNLLYKSFNF